MNGYILKLRELLKTLQADAILINSADEFLSEYNIPSLNSRLKVTGFSGSTGDCIVSADKIWQIADGRYHQQADNEVDHNIVTVLKIKQGQLPTEEIAGVLKDNSTLVVTANKVSVDFCERLEKKCSEKNIKIKYISKDILDDSSQNDYTNVPLTVVDKRITSLSSEEKFRYFSSKLKEKQVLLVTVPVDFAYLTNLRNYDFPFCSAPRAKAVITPNSLAVFTNSKIPFKFENLEIYKLDDFGKYISGIFQKEILTDKKTVSQADFMQIDKSNTISETNLFDIKAEKYESEINHLKEAFKKTDNVLRKMNDLINSDKTLSEYDLFCAINEFFRQEGALAQSFKPIIASGSNSSIIHYSVADKNKIINDGDFVMLDCGGYFDGGIATDITRTFIKGEPNQEQKRIYTKVLKAFINTYNKEYSEDITWFDIDFITRQKLLDEEENGWSFSHSTGHGIGISVHEFPPRCASFDDYKKPFRKNYVFSIEPGLYKKNTGGVRLENAVYVKSVSPKIEFEVLSHYPFEEKLINFSMLNKKEKNFLEDWQNYGKKNNFGK